MDEPLKSNGYNRHHGGGGHGHYQGGGRKRRFRGDDDREDRPTRRPKYEEPVASRLRREILVIAESGQSSSDEAARFGDRIAENFDDDQVRGPFLDTMVELLAEQPLKIPFIAAVVLYANEKKGEVAKEMLAKVTARAQDAMEIGRWREFKLMLRFFACLQSVFEGDGLFPVLDELFDRAADQQTASQEDTTGLELVKIILLTLPYIMAYSSTGVEKASESLAKTEIIASVQHPMEDLAEPYPVEHEDRPFSYASALELLQKQLQQEASDGWKVACLPRPYEPRKPRVEENGDATMADADLKFTKHAPPSLPIPSTIHAGPRPLFPETYFSIYADQEFETVPKATDIASSLIRDVVADTINILDFSRNSVAKFLIEVDCFFAPGTFTKRGLSFDKIRDLPDGQSTWKPEDMVLDAIFAQMLLLPSAEHKLVYYHSVITEACKLAPAAIAPTLGRAIRFLYRSIDFMDVELVYRFLDWFAHHLSNYDFRWKWVEWIDEVEASDISPKKAFIIGALDKEIRLSFPKRIRETLPKEYHKLMPEVKEQDVPPFKFSNPDTPFSAEGKAILQLLRKRAPETEIQPLIDAIQDQASQNGSTDPLIESTDGYMTAVCYIGAKSLSHVLSCIERCKERLLAIGPQSEPARGQIIQSVVSYWTDLPGTAVNIVDKLLNYTIVTPESVVRWCLASPVGDNVAVAQGLSESWRYEMLASTMGKVTHRVRQIVQARVQALKAGISDEQMAQLDGTLSTEREGMRALFALILQLLEPLASEVTEMDEDAEERRQWAIRWTRVFRRKAAVEQTIVGEDAVVALAERAKVEWAREERRKAEEAAERERKRAEQEKREEEERLKRVKAEEKKEERERERDRALMNGDGDDDAGGQELDVADI